MMIIGTYKECKDYNDAVVEKRSFTNGANHWQEHPEPIDPENDLYAIFFWEGVPKPENMLYQEELWIEIDLRTL